MYENNVIVIEIKSIHDKSCIFVLQTAKYPTVSKLAGAEVMP